MKREKSLLFTTVLFIREEHIASEINYETVFQDTLV